ncbi:MAG: hypothetical protein H6834_10300 [Planctomycetes bacterium]|nr:hypothetical protein [Planctomycetota bacterium]
MRLVSLLRPLAVMSVVLHIVVLSSHAQDECSQAMTILTGLSGPFSNKNATTSQPAWPCGAGGNDLWYRYAALCNGTASISTCGLTQLDTVLEVFDGDCGSLTSLACNDDSSCGLQSTVTFNVVAFRYYYFRVGGFASSRGSFVLNVTCSGTPGNDECATPIALSDGLSAVYSNAGATTSPEPWSCGPRVTNDVWFSYTATCSGSATVDTCFNPFGTAPDTVMEVYSGACGSLVSAGCSDNACGLQSRVTWNVIQGLTYYIRVGGVGGQTGSFQVSVQCTAGPPPNDDCSQAITVGTGLNGPYTNDNATVASPWSCPPFAAASADVWFTHVATHDLTLRVDTCNFLYTNIDTVIQVYSGSNCSNLTSIACNDDFCGLRSQVEFAAQRGVRYYFRVGSYSNSPTGTIGLTLTYLSSVANDECFAAIPVAIGTSGPYSNVGSSTSLPAWPCGLGACDVWFLHQAQCNGTLTIDTCVGQNFDTTLEVLSSGLLCTSASLQCNDDACGVQSRVSIPVTTGAVYYFRVGGFNGATGSFNLTLSYSGGMGSFTSRPTGCGPAVLTASGGPSIGGTVQYTLTGFSGSPYLWIGNALPAIPLCPPSSCSLAADLGIVVPIASLTIPIPCDPALIGGAISVQGGDLGSPFGCGTLPFTFATSNTVDTVLM